MLTCAQPTSLTGGAPLRVSWRVPCTVSGANIATITQSNSEAAAAQGRYELQVGTRRGDGQPGGVCECAGHRMLVSQLGGVIGSLVNAALRLRVSRTAVGNNVPDVIYGSYQKSNVVTS